MENEKIRHRQEIGKEIKNINTLSTYRLIKDAALQISQQKAIENGTANYTIDSLLAYCRASGIRVKFEKID